MGRPSTKLLTFKENEVASELLNGYHLPFERETISLSKIDRRDRLLQTRRNTFGSDKEIVQEYAEDMKAGHLFPTVILARYQRGNLTIACGNHRLDSAKAAGFTKINNAYVVQLPVESDAEYPIIIEKLRSLSRQDNNKHGIRTSRAETYDGIAHDIFKDNGGVDRGMPSRDLIQLHAQRNGLKHVPMGIKSRLAGCIIQARCKRIGIAPPDTLASQDAVFGLSHLEKFEDILREVSGFKGKKLPDILKDIKARGLQSDDALKAIRDASVGFGPISKARLNSVARLRLAINTALQAFEAITQDAALTGEDHFAVEKQYEKIVEGGSSAISLIKAGANSC